MRTFCRLGRLHGRKVPEDHGVEAARDECCAVCREGKRANVAHRPSGEIAVGRATTGTLIDPGVRSITSFRPTILGAGAAGAGELASLHPATRTSSTDNSPNVRLRMRCMGTALQIQAAQALTRPETHAGLASDPTLRSGVVLAHRRSCKSGRSRRSSQRSCRLKVCGSVGFRRDHTVMTTVDRRPGTYVPVYGRFMTAAPHGRRDWRRAITILWCGRT